MKNPLQYIQLSLFSSELFIKICVTDCVTDINTVQTMIQFEIAIYGKDGYLLRSYVHQDHILDFLFEDHHRKKQLKQEQLSNRSEWKSSIPCYIVFFPFLFDYFTNWILMWSGTVWSGVVWFDDIKYIDLLRHPI